MLVVVGVRCGGVVCLAESERGSSRVGGNVVAVKLLLIVCCCCVG